VVHDLAISITWLRELSLVRVRGRVETATLDLFLQPLNRVLRFSPRPVVVDLRATRFVDLSGLVMLGTWLGSARHQGRDVEVLPGTSLARWLAVSFAARVADRGPKVQRVSVDRETDLEFCTDDRGASHSLTELFRPMDQTYWR